MNGVNGDPVLSLVTVVCDNVQEIVSPTLIGKSAKRILKKKKNVTMPHVQVRLVFKYTFLI